MIERDDQSNQQINPGVADHRVTRDGNIREWRKRQRTGYWSLHVECGASPNGFAWHDEARENADGNQARALREAAHLFEPAAHEGESVQTENNDAVRERGEPGAECEGDGQGQKAFEVNEKCTGERVFRRHAADPITHRDRAAERESDESSDHARESK